MFLCSHTVFSGPGYRSRYSDWLRAGRSGDRIPVGGEIFRTCPDRPFGPSSLLYKGYRVFPGGKERPGRDADRSPLLVPWSRKSRVIPLFPLWAVWPVQSLSACTEPQCLYSTAIPLLPLWTVRPVQSPSACTRVHCTFTLHHLQGAHCPCLLKLHFSHHQLNAFPDSVYY